MKHYFTFTLLALVMVFFACNKPEQKTEESTTTSTQEKMPYVIEDSSKIVKYPSGLQMYVVEEGTGPVPMATDTVAAMYHGTFLDGNVFDSSYMKNQAIPFPLNGVIAGWTEALTKVGVGSKIKIICPPNIAYGAAGRAGIPPNSTLVFDIMLVKVFGKE